MPQIASKGPYTKGLHDLATAAMRGFNPTVRGVGATRGS